MIVLVRIQTTIGTIAANELFFCVIMYNKD